MTGPSSAFMRESDAFSWYLERDPALRSTVVAVAWLERLPDWDVLVDKLERATRAVPLFRHRPVEVPGRIATPRWTADPAFDLCWHLRRVGCPAPHTAESVLELAAAAATTGFDQSRPLWEFSLVDGIEGDRAALVMKLHHSLTDGVGGVEMALLLFDACPGPARCDPLPEPPPVEHLDRGRLVGAALTHVAKEVVGDARTLVRSVPSAALHLVRHPVGSLDAVGETLTSIGRTVKPVRSTLSPLMTERGLGRRLFMLSAPVDGLKAAAGSVGGTLNDGFLAAVTGGLRRYHDRHGVALGDLLVMLPISLRTPSDPMGGNRITLQRFRVPAGIASPSMRIEAIGRRCRSARAERSLGLTELIAGSLNLLPSGVVGSMFKHVDFLASDVPGFPFPVYLAGAPVTGYYPFGPTLGSAVNATLFSYAGTCCIGLTVDDRAVPQPDELVGCLQEGLAEVLDLGQPEVSEIRRRATTHPPGRRASAPAHGDRAARRPKGAEPC